MTQWTTMHFELKDLVGIFLLLQEKEQHLNDHLLSIKEKIQNKLYEHLSIEDFTCLKEYYLSLLG